MQKSLVLIGMLALSLLFFGCTQTSQQPSLTVEEIKNKSTNISYDELMRNSQNYVNRMIYFRGEVLQVIPEYNDYYTIRLATKKQTYSAGYSGDDLLFGYNGQRLLEGDIIDLWGIFSGTEGYTTIFNEYRTVPKVTAYHLELVTKASEKPAVAVPNVAMPTLTATPVPSPVYEEKYYGIIQSHNNFEINLTSAGKWTHLEYETLGDNVTDFRVDISVKNIGKQKASIYPELYCHLFEGKTQYDCNMISTSFSGGEFYPGVVRNGSLIFNHVPVSDTVNVTIEGEYNFNASQYQTGLTQYQYTYELKLK